MMRIVSAALVAAALTLPAAAQASEGGGGGDRQPAGGGHMSSYVSDPYHDPRAIRAQRNRTGPILGAAMYSDLPGTVVSRRDAGAPHWAAGAAPRR